MTTEIDKPLSDKEKEGLILSVVDELMGIELSSEEANAKIAQIADLRTRGLLTEKQMQLLDVLGIIAAVDPEF